MLRVSDLGPDRPPCSVAERAAALTVERSLRRTGLVPVLERVRAPTSPTWALLLRALLRLWAAAFLAGGWPDVALGLAAASVAGGLPRAAGLIRFIPLLGATSRNVVAVRRGFDAEARPVIVVAHMDTHPTAGAPMNRVHVFAAAASGWLALISTILAPPGLAGWRSAAGLVAAESVITLVWLSRRELAAPIDPPDDNTSGLLSLVRLAELTSDGTHRHDVWLVATAAGTSGGYGLTSFFRRHGDVRNAWVVEIDALGTGEVVTSALPPRFPHPGTPAALIRAVVSAARGIGDPLAVRRVRRPHSDGWAALRLRVPAVVLTAGLRPPAGGPGPDPANAERAALVVDSLVRLDF